jgi:hypothetical protein
MARVHLPAEVHRFIQLLTAEAVAEGNKRKRERGRGREGERGAEKEDGH